MRKVVAGSLIMVVLAGCGLTPRAPTPPAAPTPTAATPVTSLGPKSAAPVAPPRATATHAPTTVTRFRSCAEVRAAGKAPLYRGQRGWNPELDRDNDGVACER